MICQGWRRLGKMQESLRRPYYQLLVRQLAQEQDFRGRAGLPATFINPYQGAICRRNLGSVSV